MMTNPNQRGFTLVETLVAITIIALAMVGPLYAVQQSLNASRNARDQLVASSLAQEGIEYVRSIRDANYLTVLGGGSRSWLYGLDGTSGSTNCTSPCVVDPDRGTISNTIAPLRLNNQNMYTQQNGVGNAFKVTPYTRTVQIAAVSGSTTEVVVTVTVTWSTNGRPQTVTLTERLHNWL